MPIKHPASLACQVKSAIRIREELPYTKMTNILKRVEPYIPSKHQRYFLSFFEECSPRLIKKFMAEQNISREQIISMYDALPDRGEKIDFGEALRNGKF